MIEMKLGKYNIEEELYKGQDSTIYLGRHEVLTDKIVVIKTGNRERLQVEARLIRVHKS